MSKRLRTLVVLLAGLTLATPSLAAYRASVLIEPTTGTVLETRNAETPLPTASMIKMLTMLVVEDALEAGTVSLEDPVRISRHVHLVDGTGVYLAEGEVHRFEDVRAAAMIHSANDASMALAEAVAGSEEAFLERMREKARSLGIDPSHIHTPNGLATEDTGKPLDRLTALDLAKLGAAVHRDRELMELAGTKTRRFPGREFLLFNSNHLLRRYDAATGIKTGYTRQADFNVTASATRDGMSLIAVVMGAERKDECFRTAERILERGFQRYRLVAAVEEGEALRHLRVRGGVADAVPTMAASAVRWVEDTEGPAPEVAVRVVDLGVTAPVRAGQPVGAALVYRDGRFVDQVPALAAEPVEKAGRWERWKETMREWGAALVGG